MGCGLAAGCQVFYRKIYRFFYSVRPSIAYERRRVLLTNHWYETKGIEVLLKTPLLYQEDFLSHEVPLQVCIIANNRD